MNKKFASILILFVMVSLEACSGEETSSETSQLVTTTETTVSQLVSMEEDTTVNDTLPMSTQVIPVDSNERGNSTNNNTRNGIAAIKGDWIYYKNMDGALLKIRTDGTEETTLIESGCYGWINVVGDWVYFTELGQIVKVKTDGSERQAVSERFVIDSEAYGMSVIGEWIYYMKPGDLAFYKLKTDGSEEILITNNYALDVSIVDEWMYYYNLDDMSYSKIKTDGSEQSIITKDYVGRPVIYEDMIFWLGTGGILSTNLDGTNATMIVDDTAVVDFSIDNGWIYYQLSEPGSNSSRKMLCKIKIDGTQEQVIVPARERFYENLNIVGDWIYYTAVVDSNRELFRIRTDGSDEQMIVSASNG